MNLSSLDLQLVKSKIKLLHSHSHEGADCSTLVPTGALDNTVPYTLKSAVGNESSQDTLSDELALDNLGGYLKIIMQSDVLVFIGHLTNYYFSLS